MVAELNQTMLRFVQLHQEWNVARFTLVKQVFGGTEQHFKSNFLHSSAQMIGNDFGLAVKPNFLLPVIQLWEREIILTELQKKKKNLKQRGSSAVKDWF